ncbi:MAG: exodeoxyribonuclease III [Oligoflexales bacterium]
MIICTWNVNSIKARQERFCKFVERVRPDVLCLQELKCLDEAFPLEAVQALGYECHTFGQKTYNGVAILSRLPVTNVKKGFCEGFPEARYIEGTVGNATIVSVYVPNGQEVGSEKYRYKLDWLAKLEEHLAQHPQRGGMMAICGDFNIAPTNRDVHDVTLWKDKILFSEPEKAALQKICDVGFGDVYREANPHATEFSWWDYRGLAFPFNRGLRIDFILATEKLRQKTKRSWMERDERKGQKPSDHIPVLAEFDLDGQ